MRESLVIMISAVLVCFACESSADTIFLRNGHVINGEVVAQKDGILTIREKFSGDDYGESYYALEDINLIEKEKIPPRAPEGKNFNDASNEDLKGYFQPAFSENSPITTISFKEGSLTIRYYFSSLDDQDNDRDTIKGNIYKVLDIIRKNTINNLHLIKIEASAITPERKGIISSASITSLQLKSYQGKPEQLLVEDMKDFQFNEKFYYSQ